MYSDVEILMAIHETISVFGIVLLYSIGMLLAVLVME